MEAFSFATVKIFSYSILYNHFIIPNEFLQGDMSFALFYNSNVGQAKNSHFCDHILNSH